MFRLCCFIIEFVRQAWFIDFNESFGRKEKMAKKSETNTSADCRYHPLGQLYTLLGTLTVLPILNIKHCSVFH